MKKCSKCKLTKPLDNYYVSNSSSSGYQSNCVECCLSLARQYSTANHDLVKEQARAWYHAHKEETKERRREKDRIRYKNFRDLLNSHKKVPCKDCNGRFDPYVMDFDHRNPKEKTFMVSASMGYNKKEIINEIAKCDVVCVNCHRLRTQTQRVEKICASKQWINEIKNNNPCMDCGVYFRYFQMDFDHRNTTNKSFNIASPRGGKIAIENEIAKCDLVCANCHRIRTNLQGF